MEHTTDYYYGDEIKVTEPLTCRWIGYKTIFYIFKKYGNVLVKLEQWLDEATDNENHPGNTWRSNPVHQATDEGEWGAKDNNGHCGGTSNQIITWGSPTTNIKIGLYRI